MHTYILTHSQSLRNPTYGCLDPEQAHSYAHIFKHKPSHSIDAFVRTHLHTQVHVHFAHTFPLRAYVHTFTCLCIHIPLTHHTFKFTV